MSELKFKKIKILVEKEGIEEEICIEVPENHTVNINSTWGVNREFDCRSPYADIKHTGKQFHRIIVFPEYLQKSIDRFTDRDIENSINN